MSGILTRLLLVDANIKAICMIGPVQVDDNIVRIR